MTPELAAGRGGSSAAAFHGPQGPAGRAPGCRSVSVAFPGPVTQQGCCHFACELLKHVLYQRHQLPLPYEQLAYFCRRALPRQPQVSLGLPGANQPRLATAGWGDNWRSPRSATRLRCPRLPGALRTVRRETLLSRAGGWPSPPAPGNLLHFSACAANRALRVPAESCASIACTTVTLPGAKAGWRQFPAGSANSSRLCKARQEFQLLPAEVECSALTRERAATDQSSKLSGWFRGSSDWLQKVAWLERYLLEPKRVGIWESA